MNDQVATAALVALPVVLSMMTACFFAGRHVEWRYQQRLRLVARAEAGEVE